MMLVNLRGVKESGTAFAIPTYIFLVITLVTIGTGLVRYLAGDLAQVTGVTPAMMEAAKGLGLFLILRAFSSGCTALTGVEAISNGVTAFKQPQSRNAGITLIWMSVILAVMFISITFLSIQVGAQFSLTETVISQLGRAIWGNGVMWYVLLGSTTLILMMAANTSYAGFPRLGALQAGDGFLPRQLTFKGSRLVFSLWHYRPGRIGILVDRHLPGHRPPPSSRCMPSVCSSPSRCHRPAWQSAGGDQVILKRGRKLYNRGSGCDLIRKWKIKMIINSFGAVSDCRGDSRICGDQVRQWRLGGGRPHPCTGISL